MTTFIDDAGLMCCLPHWLFCMLDCSAGIGMKAMTLLSLHAVCAAVLLIHSAASELDMTGSADPKQVAIQSALPPFDYERAHTAYDWCECGQANRVRLQHTLHVDLDLEMRCPRVMPCGHAAVFSVLDMVMIWACASL